MLIYLRCLRPDLVQMSWLELERLVEDAEKEPQLARALRHCRSNPELVLAARRLGYRVTRVDLEQARLADKKEHEQQNLAAHLSN